jgi:predicted acylesterase/phospholipase RssA
MGNLGNPKLYSYSRVGTKRLVDDFTVEIVGELKELAQELSNGSKLEIKSAIELFRELKHSYGNTALLLSGGGSLGTHHIGVMKAIHEQGLLPRIICGSSSGAIMASFACTRTEDDYDRLVSTIGH